MGVIEVPLTQSKVAVVDEQDAFVRQYRWSAVYRHGVWYASRHGENGEPSVVYLHQDILRVSPGLTVDHISGDGLDNRRSNLRAATKQQQKWNTRPRAGTSRFKGVSWMKDTERRGGGRWLCKIVTPTGRAIVKYARTEEDAARMYDSLARTHFGEFARLNDLPQGVK